MASPLGYVYSRADALKRRLYDMITNPADYASMLGGRIQEGAANRESMMNQAFGDPNNPLKVTNPQALAQLTDMIMSGEMGFAPAGITAFHGSPYLFKQFDPMKVGTGEGAQAYGVGAGYTAEARPVAEGYRSATTRDRYTSQEGVFEPSSLEHLNVKATLRKDGLDKAIEVAKKYAVPDTDYPEVAAKAARDLAVLERLKQSGGVQPMEGYLYKGDIPDEILPKFLNWDIPIKDQPAEIKGALDDIINTVIKKDVDQVVTKIRKSVPNFKFENVHGKNVYQFVADKFEQDAKKLIKKGENISDPKLWGQQKATELFQEKGLSGIRYLDEQSRAAGTGTSNFIPFNPQDFKIEQINDIPLQDWISKGLLAP
jgi:hypothetical protein